MSDFPRITDTGHDGVEGWAEILSEASDPEKLKRLRSVREETIEAVREHGKEWLREEIKGAKEALESLRRRYERADWTVYDNAESADDFDLDDLDLEGLSAEEQAERIREVKEQARENEGGAMWAGDEAPEPLVRRRNELRRKRRQVRERLSVLRAVRDEIAAEGLPPEGDDSEDGRETSEEELWRTLREVLDELLEQPSASSFVDDICEGVAENFAPGKPSKAGIRRRLEKKVLPLLHKRYSDLDLPEGLSLKAWRARREALEEARQRWKSALL